MSILSRKIIVNNKEVIYVCPTDVHEYSFGFSAESQVFEMARQQGAISAAILRGGKWIPAIGMGSRYPSRVRRAFFWHERGHIEDEDFLDFVLNSKESSLEREISADKYAAMHIGREEMLIGLTYLLVSFFRSGCSEEDKIVQDINKRAEALFVGVEDNVASEIAKSAMEEVMSYFN